MSYPSQKEQRFLLNSLPFSYLWFLTHPVTQPLRQQREKVLIMAARPLVTLVTGASTGFGALTARALAKSGHVVYAGLYHPNDDGAASYQDIAKFAKDNQCKLLGVPLDVVKDESIQGAVDKILAEEGRIDVIVHNAGKDRRAQARKRLVEC